MDTPQEDICSNIEPPYIKETKKKYFLTESGSFPRDKYSFFVFVFLFLGISQFLSYTFYSAANNYWLYKFRNTSIANYSSDDRTGLQVYYSTANIIAGAGSVLVFNLLNILFGQRFPFLVRIRGALLMLTANFLIMQIFTKINTDSFQLLFFVVSMACYAMIMSSQTVYTTASMMLFVCFPTKYMYVFLFGQNAAGILNGLVQIVSVSVVDSIENSAFIYFTIGTIVIVLSLTIITLASKTAFFHHYLEKAKQRPQRKMTDVSKQTFVRIIRALAPNLLLFFILNLGHSAVNCVTPLAVSQNEDSVWGRTYFYPVVGFLLADVMGLIGKIISSSQKLRVPYRVLTPLIIIAPIVFAILIWTCNIKPKSNFPVWFGMDYQYAFIWGTHNLIHGYSQNNIIIKNVEMIKRDLQADMELAFNLFMLGSTIAGFVSAPVGLLALNFI
ncbi:equilibrative nucleoside transporter 3-like [Cylas formicarius]|uniref:equilibrative nucleoside transporter 3-like n=1 Tax=Cylas formicarius TaxID=197179 RepID=UPI002958D23E|nr:equilibrative nucleoside transporter 3-like [Cylas formicarius]